MEQRHLKMTESFGVIVVMFLILGTLIIKYKMSPQIPILCCFYFTAGCAALPGSRLSMGLLKGSSQELFR